MTVGELIEKLSKLPPSTLVATQSNDSYEDISVYRFNAHVEHHGGWSDISEDNGRDDVEAVALITCYGNPDKEWL